ncbi:MULTISPECIES: GAP family protein [unclassified Leucobacter]|uniref:GAP family protein n=1 Tax=unclassified Leucobacter TaxID=2621730 RepID=UPI00165D4F09|nr:MULTISPECIES: GAP family protein [unclassified Leucobacter]MBC9926776.1 GAP family protein [Leucobacter sp. cx-169]
MGDLGQLLPLGLGSIISPLPIVAIVAILLSPRGGRNGLAYVAAVILVGFAFTLVAALSTAGAGAGGSDKDDTVVLVITAALALGFTVLAVVSWLGRPRGGAAASMPSWLAAVDSLTPLKAAGLGALMAVTNSKNIPLELKAGSLIGAHDLGVLMVIALSAMFAIYASLGILLPTLLAASGSQRVIAVLERLKTEMVQHNAAIMTVLFAVLAAVEASHLIHQLVR